METLSSSRSVGKEGESSSNNPGRAATLERPLSQEVWSCQGTRPSQAAQQEGAGTRSSPAVLPLDWTQGARIPAEICMEVTLPRP